MTSARDFAPIVAAVAPLIEAETKRAYAEELVRRLQAKHRRYDYAQLTIGLITNEGVGRLRAKAEAYRDAIAIVAEALR